jgi:hypothetical protein
MVDPMTPAPRHPLSRIKRRETNPASYRQSNEGVRACKHLRYAGSPVGMFGSFGSSISRLTAKTVSEASR